jgi:hypothetical protein
MVGIVCCHGQRESDRMSSLGERVTTGGPAVAMLGTILRRATKGTGADRMGTMESENPAQLSPGSDRRLAVYGSLAPGRPNHHQLSDLSGRWIKGTVQGSCLNKVGVPTSAIRESFLTLMGSLLACCSSNRRISLANGPDWTNSKIQAIGAPSRWWLRPRARCRHPYMYSPPTDHQVLARR